MAYERPFPTDATMTAVAIGYANPIHALIADDVLPRIPVASEKFKWTFYPRGQMFSFPPTRVGRTGRVNRVEFSGEERTDAIEDYGLEDAIPITDIEEAASMRRNGFGIFDPLITSTAGLTNLILLDREVRAASYVQDPNNYTPGRREALLGGAKFSDYQNSDPIGVLKHAFASTLIFRPNTMSMSRDTWSVLSSHPHVVNAIKGNVTGRGIVTPKEFIELFSGEGLKKLAIGEGFVNTARKGQPDVISRVWGKSIQLAFLNTETRPERGGVTWGFTATYGNRVAGHWPDKDIGLLGGEVVRVGERVKEVVAAPDVGYLIQNAIA